MRDFINTIISYMAADFAEEFQPVEEITILNPFNYVDLSMEKESILDVKARDSINCIINIAIKVFPDYSFRELTIYYLSKLYSGQHRTFLFKID